MIVKFNICDEKLFFNFIKNKFSEFLKFTPYPLEILSNIRFSN
jgi:hypothetical protein